MKIAAAIKEMHEKCAVYTASETANRLLDIAEWTAGRDLTSAVLLEPCAGEGAILVEAVRRLIASFRQHDRPLATRSLKARIKAFEFHGPAAAAARRAVRLVLMNEGIGWAASGLLAEAWVHEADFLLHEPAKATHVVANPPYLRWSKLPLSLAAEYRKSLRPLSTRGDVAVAFLDRMIEWTRPNGRIAALVSDRWMFAQYGADFIADIKGKGWSLAVIDDQPVAPFVRRVGVSSAIVRLSMGAPISPSPDSVREIARTRHAALVTKYGTLADAGCIVKVGPALGCGETFLLDATEAATIENELVRPYLSRKALTGGVIDYADLNVVVPYDRRGQAIEIEYWPNFLKWARKHETSLKARSHVQGQERWWKTIDAIGSQWNDEPKLLLGEMSTHAEVSLDLSGSIPAHSVYAIWSSEWPIEALQRVLNAGLLQLTAEAEAPRLKQRWFRFYKRFIVRTPLPKWTALSKEEQLAFEGENAEFFTAAFYKMFGFWPMSHVKGVAADSPES
ncbi:N-6 DNA methylase [Sphingopyxis sp. OPL5]|uniref:Eco57I restriction-modification methylase domain-containing protein n=1 Tax=Sphingopyxis sp. OPL5 TaxID=2486273 RepID=UPI00164D2B68|nr:N-6 DNA methylase [Sphingopyxis sp. OPL5]QNO26377.1 N-6 DNA methylase [Sphingopyxis sp. OPL5]